MSEDTLPEVPPTEDQQNILNKLNELVEKSKDREASRMQKTIDSLKERNTALEAQIVELKKTSPDVQTIITQHQAAVKVHSARAKQAIIDSEEIRREAIFLRRKVAEKDKELAEVRKELAQARQQLNDLSDEIQRESATSRPEPNQENSPTRLRRSRRSSQIPG